MNLTKKISQLVAIMLLAASVPLAFALDARATGSSIQITETMVNPSKVSDVYGEWIELTNTTATTVDLSNWSLAGKTIDNLIIEPNDSAVICRSSDTNLNGGVICDKQMYFTLTNSGKTVELTDNNDILIDSLEYSGSNVLAGRSIQVNEGGLGHENKHQYGKGDFGRPANNSFGYVVMQASTDTNSNGFPDVWHGEKIEDGWMVSLYNQDGSLRNSLQTTRVLETFPWSEYFVSSPGNYTACLEFDPTNHQASYAMQADGWVEHHTVETTRSDNTICSQVELKENQYIAQKFGVINK